MGSLASVNEQLAVGNRIAQLSDQGGIAPREWLDVDALDRHAEGFGTRQGLERGVSGKRSVVAAQARSPRQVPHGVAVIAIRTVTVIARPTARAIVEKLRLS